MGSFHGRRKPLAKKTSHPKGDTAEDIAARQARDQFIKDMAEKAASLLPAEAADNGGIHPSRLARTDPSSGGRPNNNYTQYSQSERPARGQRAPDLRKPNNKRTFDDAAESNGIQSHLPAKKQRTLEEIRRLKGPAAMKKEEEKRRRQAEAEKVAKTAEPVGAPAQAETSKVDSEDDDTPIPSKNGKKRITDEGKPKKTPEEKLKRKQEKAARKQAKNINKDQSDSDAAEGAAAPEPEDAPASESKEARKERKRAEKAAKKAAIGEKEPATVVTEHEETKEEKKTRKRLAKLAAKTPDASTEEAIEANDKESRKAAKKEKKAQRSVPEADPPKEQVPSASNWSQAASSLGSKSSKFMKLLGGAKNGIVAEAAGTDDKVRNARKAEKELQRQYESGMQAKQHGNKRTGLGA